MTSLAARLGAEQPPEFVARLIAADGKKAEGEAILAAIDELPEVFREAILLVNVDGLRYDEAAEVLGVPSGTVKTRLMRGRAQLREILAGSPEQDVELTGPQRVAESAGPQLGQLVQSKPGVACPDVRERLRDRVDLGETRRHADLERRLELGEVHAVERRHAAVRAGPLREQRVVVHGVFRRVGHVTGREGEESRGAGRRGVNADPASSPYREVGPFEEPLQLAFIGGNQLDLRVEPVGDYSTYTLQATYEDAGGDAEDAEGVAEGGGHRRRAVAARRVQGSCADHRQRGGDEMGPDRMGHGPSVMPGLAPGLETEYGS